MFNQEMPAEYIPRKYMIRGVLDPKLGLYFEIVRNNKVVGEYFCYAFAVNIANSLEKTK